MRSIMMLFRALLSGEPYNKHKIHAINYLQRCIGHTLHSLGGCAQPLILGGTSQVFR